MFNRKYKNKIKELENQLEIAHDTILRKDREKSKIVLEKDKEISDLKSEVEKLKEKVNKKSTVKNTTRKTSKSMKKA